jgi:hypothetical protein
MWRSLTFGAAQAVLNTKAMDNISKTIFQVTVAFDQFLITQISTNLKLIDLTLIKDGAKLATCSISNTSLVLEMLSTVAVIDPDQLIVPLNPGFTIRAKACADVGGAYFQ